MIAVGLGARGRGFALSVACLLAGPVAALAQSAPQPRTAAQRAQDLRRLSIEELAAIDVTTASRRSERLIDVAGAVSVVQNAEIRRSGATTGAEAIRLAVGVHGARSSGPSWGITTRGFNISTANKMLVLIDGRTVYSPLFSGVFWDSQHLLLDDVEQIEVTR
jgi:iron complex outermembrane receptor protein